MKILVLSYGSAETVPQDSDIRSGHRAHLRSLGDRLLSSGAFQSEDGAHELGRALLVEMEHEAEARTFVAADPFTTAGITTRIEIFRWNLKWWQGQPLG